MGVAVHSAPDLPFNVGSRPGHIIYRWHPSLMVRGKRVWVGIAQCMLTFAGIDWTSEQVDAVVACIFQESDVRKVV